MPLSTGYSTLNNELNAAYTKARDDGAEGIDVIPKQSEDVGNAIHKYMESADVFTDVDVDPGQQAFAASCVTVNSTGVYSGPGSGNGTGIGPGAVTFGGPDVSSLISDIETAYYKARDDGTEGVDVIPGLAADMKTAIHKFALTATVKTDVVVNPGVNVSAYMFLAGTVPTAMPSVSQAGTGTGEGSLS